MEKIIQIKTDREKDDCLRVLTRNNNNLTQCHKYYDIEYINRTVEYSDFIIYFINKENHKDIVAFALVKSQSKMKGKILNVLLVCAIPNMNTFVAHSLYNYALTYKYPFIYVSPRTPDLRETFIKYGFESICGREEIDEVLEKELEEVDFEYSCIP